MSSAPYAEAPFGIADIIKLIPHRYPFLMIDKVTEIDPGRSAVGIKNLTINEWHFSGHFPNVPIMPGVLIIEAIAQMAGIMLGSAHEIAQDNTGIYYLAKIKEAKFLRVVNPGDQMIISVQTRVRQARMAMVSGTVSVEGETVATGDLCLAS